MAPHFTEKELDLIVDLYAKGKTPPEIWERVVRTRERAGIDPPELQAIQRAVRGRTHKRGRSETRGRKPHVFCRKP